MRPCGAITLLTCLLCLESTVAKGTLNVSNSAPGVDARVFRPWWSSIRPRVLVDGATKRQLLRETGIRWKTLEKILKNPVPPGYGPRRRQPQRRKATVTYRADHREAMFQIRGMITCLTAAISAFSRGMLPRREWRTLTECLANLGHEAPERTRPEPEPHHR
jgi:hypothetical protein